LQADEVEALQHAPLDFGLQYRGVGARPGGALERSPRLPRVEAKFAHAGRAAPSL